MISFDPFWKTLKEKSISQYELINTHGISSGTIYRIKNRKILTLYTIERLCNILEVSSDQIVIITPDKVNTHKQEQ